jgi:hypothetical protein
MTLGAQQIDAMVPDVGRRICVASGYHRQDEWARW